MKKLVLVFKILLGIVPFYLICRCYFQNKYSCVNYEYDNAVVIVD